LDRQSAAAPMRDMLMPGRCGNALTGHGILEVENLESACHRGDITGGWVVRLRSAAARKHWTSSEQLEPQLEDLEAQATVAEAQAPVEIASRKKAERKPLPVHSIGRGGFGTHWTDTSIVRVVDR